MDRNKLYRRISGREVIRRLEEVKKELGFECFPPDIESCKKYSHDTSLGSYESQIYGAIDNLKFENTFVMAKIEQSGKIVRILSFSENVRFSEEVNWFLCNMEPHKRMGDLRWISTNMRFTWIREFLWMI